jgi:hypothetical protein
MDPPSHAALGLQGGREDGFCGSGDIGLPHQAFANQETAGTKTGQIGQIGGGVQAGFGDDQAAFGDVAGEMAGVVSSVTSKVLRLRLLMPIRGDFSIAARSNSARS